VAFIWYQIAIDSTCSCQKPTGGEHDLLTEFGSVARHQFGKETPDGYDNQCTPLVRGGRSWLVIQVLRPVETSIFADFLFFTAPVNESSLAPCSRRWSTSWHPTFGVHMQPYTEASSKYSIHLDLAWHLIPWICMLIHVNNKSVGELDFETFS